MMTNDILNTLISEIKSSKYFYILLDETSDISCLEQVTIHFKFIEEDCTIREEFFSFYQTGSTISETLFRIVKDMFTSFQLDVTSLRRAVL